jgi:hypothetical protein
MYLLVWKNLHLRLIRNVAILLVAVVPLVGCAPENVAPVAPQSAATAEAMSEALRTENASLIQQLTEIQTQIEQKDVELADAREQLAAAQAELDTLKFGAQRLLADAEKALQQDNLQEAQRVSALLADKHPGTPETIRATEIVALLEASAADRAAAEQERIAAATDKMTISKDEVRSITFYRDQSTPEISLSNQFYLYIGQNAERVWLRLYIMYYGSEWLFVDSFIIKAGDQVFPITPGYGEFQRDNSAYSIWEWYDGSVTAKEVEIVQAIIRGRCAGCSLQR